MNNEALLYMAMFFDFMWLVILATVLVSILRFARRRKEHDRLRTNILLSTLDADDAIIPMHDSRPRRD